MKIKVHGGTPGFLKPSLCLSCRNATIIVGANGDEVRHCFAISRNQRAPNHVIECTAYSDRTHPLKHEFEEIAWTLRTDRWGKTIGFSPPKKEDDEPRQAGFKPVKE